MGGKTYIGGTAYDITGGKTLIGGTAYDITGGKTLIGGTAYDINFKPAIVRLFEDMTVVNIAGRNNSSTGRISLTGVMPSDGNHIYIFSIYNQKLTLRKYTNSGGSFTTTNLVSTATISGMYRNTSNGNAYLTTGTSATSGTSTSPSNSTVYGGTLAVVNFPSFTVSEVTNILSEATITVLAGRAASSTANVRTLDKTHTLILAAKNANLDIWDGINWVKLNGTSTNAASVNTSTGYLTCGSVYAANMFGID